MEQVIKLTDASFKEFKSSGIALIDVFTDWCGPCRAISPIIDELSSEFSIVKFGKIDADENRETVISLGIRKIPTILIYKDGEIVERQTGSMSKTMLSELINKHLN